MDRKRVTAVSACAIMFEVIVKPVPGIVGQSHAVNHFLGIEATEMDKGISE